MKFGSVCSGIDAASVAWGPLGWHASWFSEIEAFPSAVLKYHYPNVPNFGDISLLPNKITTGEIEAPELLCGGTPCQAFSVAGLRNSLQDQRGNLTSVFCDIANKIDEKRIENEQTESIIFWENVPGVLSTKDNAFGCFLAALSGEECALLPPGGKWTNTGCVFGPKRNVAWRVLDAQYFGLAQRRKRVFVIASARKDFDPASVLFEFDGVRRDTAPGRETREESSTGAGASATFSCQGIGAYLNDNMAATLLKSGQDLGNGCEALITTARMVAFGEYVADDTASTIKARDYKDATDLVVQPVSFHPTQDQISSTNGISHALGCGSSTGQASVAVSHKTLVRRLTPIECERLMGFPDNYTNIPWSMSKEAIRKGLNPSLVWAFKRIMGCANFKNSPDGLRYKALGNSWAVPVVRWIGERINNQLTL